MGLIGRRDRSPVWAPANLLLDLDEDYAQVLSLLDRRLAFRSILHRLPDEIGVDVAWIGELDDAGNILLGHGVRTRTDVLDGLLVPPGIGLAGRVLQTGRPHWVRNYPDALDLTQPFSTQANHEGVKGMVAVPVVHAGQRLGILYAADRAEATYGDLTVSVLERAAARAANAAVVAERARHSAEVAVHEERRRLALQLHDTVGAMLFTLGAGVRRLGDDVAHDPDLRQRLYTIEQQAAEAAAVFRESLHALQAPPDALSLPVALRADCRSFEERTAIPTRLLVLDDLPPLPGSRAVTLAAAVREALLNIEKHAQASSVLVSVFRGVDGVTVAVHDDGVGLPAEGCAGDDRRGLGLAAAADRLGRVGGRLSAGGNDDGGVTVRASVPL
jgi:LuxR family transcriptional regulator, regulator of acetate metabolism